MLNELTQLITALRSLLETLAHCNPWPAIALLLCVTLLLVVVKS
jgi:hypothetical protein